MELLLILIYVSICYVTFKVFRIPVNQWSLATAALVLSVISLFQVIGERGVELDSGIEILSCVVTLVGLYFSYTGDAQGWFNA